MPEFKLKDYKPDDTIAAIATFPAKSALGVVKVSGRRALAIAAKVFKPAKKNKNIRQVRTYTLHYGWVIDKEEGRRKKGEKIVDEVLLSVMRKPLTYTREDVVEISSHGGVAVLNKILEVVLNQGARLALPGEFTYRALLAGRIDLIQAESIRGIVEARSEGALSLASAQLKGEAASAIKELKEGIKELFVQTESAINFPEDTSDSFPGLAKKIERLAGKSASLLEGSRKAEIMREGFKCVICGKTNAGKSTLFNRLLKEERVIVSRLLGTTRDVIEESINIRGISLRIYDTAGILGPKDLVARKALGKTLAAFEESDLVILVLDASRRLDKDDFFLLEKAKGKKVILVINKIDLPQRLDTGKIPKLDRIMVKMSALKSKGLADLEEAVHRSLYREGASRGNIIFLNRYQRQLLEQTKESLGRVKAFLKEYCPVDFINMELKSCLENLGRLSGEVFSEEILESIFSNFCIGK
jgi:tRNA modification GTPase